MALMGVSALNLGALALIEEGILPVVGLRV